MSLNKFTDTEIGKRIGLKIGCAELDCENLIVENISVDGAEFDEIKTDAINSKSEDNKIKTDADWEFRNGEVLIYNTIVPGAKESEGALHIIANEAEGTVIVEERAGGGAKYQIQLHPYIGEIVGCIEMKGRSSDTLCNMIEWDVGTGGAFKNLGRMRFKLLNADVPETQIEITTDRTRIIKDLLVDGDISGKDLALNEPSGVEIDLDSTNAGFRFQTVDSIQLLGLSSRNTGTILTYADTDETVNIRKKLICQGDIGDFTNLVPTIHCDTVFYTQAIPNLRTSAQQTVSISDTFQILNNKIENLETKGVGGQWNFSSELLQAPVESFIFTNAIPSVSLRTQFSFLDTVGDKSALLQTIDGGYDIVYTVANNIKRFNIVSGFNSGNFRVFDIEFLSETSTDPFNNDDVVDVKFVEAVFNQTLNIDSDVEFNSVKSNRLSLVKNVRTEPLENEVRLNASLSNKIKASYLENDAIVHKDIAYTEDIENAGGFTQIFSANVVINEGYLFPQHNLDFDASSSMSLYNFFPIPLGCRLLRIGIVSERNANRKLLLFKNFSNIPTAEIDISNGLSFGSYVLETPIELIASEFITFRVDVDGQGLSGQNVITAYFEKTDDNSVFTTPLTIPPATTPISNTMSNLLTELASVKEKFDALVG